MDGSNKNQKAFLIGFLLIVSVILIFISKNYFSGWHSAQISEKSTQQKDNSKKITTISDKELSKKIIAKKSLSILDIRDAESFKVEHIIDSRSTSNDDLIKILASSDKNRDYVIVDYTGESSTINLSDDMKKMANLYLLSGGFQTWKINQNQTISIGNPSAFADQAKVNYISTEDLKKMIDSNVPNLYIIDVQGGELFSEGHIKNAINMFVDDIEKRRKEIPLGKKIIVYGKDGLGGFQAGTRLFDLGIMNVFVIPDGLDGWKEKGFEVVK